MKNDSEAAALRRDLDEVLKKWRRAPAEVPKHGWIRNVREALGMTTQDLGRRMGLGQAGVASLEMSEMKEAIQLSSLRRAAKALDCTLVYALVPKRSLTHIVERRRRRIALADLAAVLPGKSGNEYRELIAAYAQQIKRNRVWRELG